MDHSNLPEYLQDMTEDELAVEFSLYEPITDYAGEAILLHGTSWSISQPDPDGWKVLEFEFTDSESPVKFAITTTGKDAKQMAEDALTALKAMMQREVQARLKAQGIEE